jgi:hypothetical protein
MRYRRRFDELAPRKLSEGPNPFGEMGWADDGGGIGSTGVES